MLRSVNQLIGYEVRGTDGELGAVHDFFIDDHEWIIRYAVVDIGALLPGRKVLIPSSGLEEPLWAEKIFPVNLAREQIENSPTVDTDKPVSRQHEERVHDHFRWIPYWAPQGLGTMTHPAAVPVGVDASADVSKKEPEGDPHLRSLQEITGYDIEANDGEVGHIDDFIIDDGDWVVRMVVADTRNWLPGKTVLLAVEWIGRIDWAERKVLFDLDKETIKGAPDFDPSEPVNRQVEVRLYDYYGRPTRFVEK